MTSPLFPWVPWETSHLNVKIYEVQEAWTSWWGLRATNHAAKASQKDIQFFYAVTPTKSPNIMGLKGIHQRGSCSFCPWCGKEGQNEGMVVNHLRTMHYHLGLVCTLCMDFLATSADTMRWHTHASKSMATEIRTKKRRKISENDGDGDEDDGYLLEEI